MSSLKDLASLIMVPSLYKDGELHTVKPLADEDIILHPDATGNHDGNDGTTDRSSSNFTFSRGSNLAATRVASSGYIEKGRENLLLQSNQFDTTWININSSETGGQSGYDGSSDAWLLTLTGGTATKLITQSISAFSGIYTASFYAKAGTHSIIQWGVSSQTDVFVSFDLSDGSIGSLSAKAIDASATSVGGGWYRIQVAFQASGAAGYSIAGVDSLSATRYQTTSSTGNFYIQDAQLEAGLVATDYIETGASTAQAGILEDMPRLDYSGGASCPALLLEPQRSNLYQHSEYIYNFQGTETFNHSNSPEGVSNAVLLTKTSASDQFVNMSWAGSSLSASTDYTMSLFVKHNGDDVDVRYEYNNSNDWGKGWYALFQVRASGVTASTTNLCTSDVQDYGNGWYRILVFVETASSITPSSPANLLRVIGASGDGVLVYGAGMEQGSYPTSYIPTYGTSVTRSNDSCLATSVSDLIGQTQGTMFIDFVFNGNPTSVDYSFMILGAIGSNYITIGGYNKSLYARVFDSTLQGTINALQMVEGTRYKVAVGYAENDVVMYVNGVNEGSDTSVSIPAVSQVGFTRPSFVHSADVNQSVVFPTRLTNAELAALTTI